MTLPAGHMRPTRPYERTNTDWRTAGMRELRIVDALELAAAYAQADYAVVMDGDALPLRVGQPAGDLEAYRPARSYALITAWNPASAPHPDSANEAADAALVARL